MAAERPTPASRRDAQPFEAEVSRLLHLMVHSVYSNRDVFLRELISNAADACERLRMLALDKPELLAGDDRLPDHAHRPTSTPARSPSRTMASAWTAPSSSTISAPSPAPARAPSSTAWRKDGGHGADRPVRRRLLLGLHGGDGGRRRLAAAPAATRPGAGAPTARAAFTIEPAALDRGAGARHAGRPQAVADDAKRYAEQATRSSASSPTLGACAGADRPQARRRRGREDARRRQRPVAEAESGGDATEEYAEFYRHVSGQFDEPALTVHYRAEGRHEYSVLLFVPSMKPFDLFDPERKGRIKLYVRRVFITDEAAILPAWLRFVRGVIDSEDLPLNLSREMLQTNPMLDAIGKAVTSRILAELDKLAENDKEHFEKIWEAFGPVLKEGLYEDPSGATRSTRSPASAPSTGGRRLAEPRRLCRGAASRTRRRSTTRSATDAAAIPPARISKASRDAASRCCSSSDPVDAFWVRTALGFDGKPFQSVTQGVGRPRSTIPLAEGRRPKAKPRREAAVATLAALFKQTLGDKVSAVRGRTGSATSAVCLVAPESGPRPAARKDPRHAPGELKPRAAPVLEINPEPRADQGAGRQGSCRRGAETHRRRGRHPLRRGAHPRRRDARRRRRFCPAGRPIGWKSV